MRAPAAFLDNAVWRRAGVTVGKRLVPEETAVAFSYDGGTYAVMMATPQDLGDFALGFSLTEGIVKSPHEIESLEIIEEPIGVELPTFVILKVVETEPSFRGDTVTGGSKPAKLETGAVVQVPFHLKEGDLIKVDTRDYTYVEKANK